MRVTALHRFPIKSTAAHVLERARLDAFGLEHDRRMMLVEPNGRFVTARKHAELVRCMTTCLDGGWCVEHPTHGQLEFSTQLGTLREVEVWGDHFRARELDPRAGRWFSELLGIEVSLVHQAPEGRRHLDPDFVPGEQETVFADGYPLLVANEASLRAVNEALDHPVEMLRFRPNIVVDGELAWEEDTWLELEIGDLRFACVKPCVRCTMTGIDLSSAERAPEPLRTLARLRRDLSFGVNLVHSGPGEIAVGARVGVSRHRPPQKLV